jgi:hypothetical protein
MEDLFQDMATDDDNGGDANEEAIVRYPEGTELLEKIANRLDEDDIMFGSPRWLENFRDMKQAAISDTHKDLLNFNSEERKKFRENLEIEYKYRSGMYIYGAMKKVWGNGCVMASHQFR